MSAEASPVVREVCVLVVEDDRELREAVCSLLADEGVPVVRADDGEEALKLLESGLRPAAVLLDLMMPGMGGLEFRRRQVEMDHGVAEVPVVVLSAWDEGRERAKELGVAAVLTKPVSAARLFETLLRCGRWVPPQA